MPRFYLPPESIHGRRFVLSGSEAHHALHVLRKKIGDELLLFDGQDASYRGRIDTVGPNQLQGALCEDLPSTTLPVQITLFQALTKGSKWEWLLEKSCEIGVSRVAPVMTRRTSIRLKASEAGEKLERWNRIALAASKQCGRADVTRVEAPRDLAVALRGLSPAVLSLIPYEKENVRTIHDACLKISAEYGTRNAVGGEKTAPHPRQTPGEARQQAAAVAAATEGGPPEASLAKGGGEGDPSSALRTPDSALRMLHRLMVNLFIGPEGGWDPAEVEEAESAGVLPVRLGPTLLRTETAGLVAATLVLREFGVY